MNLPPFVYAKAFWEMLSLLIAGLLGLLAFFGYIDPNWAVPATVILSWILALLRMLNIQPELKLKFLNERLKKAEALLRESAVLRNDLMGLKDSRSIAKAHRIGK